MSADNGVYILETISPKDSSKKEWRVAHLQAVEDINWDDNAKISTSNQDIMIKNAREMWARSPIFETKASALIAADTIESKLPICEYGICTIRIERVF